MTPNQKAGGKKTLKVSIFGTLASHPSVAGEMPSGSPPPAETASSLPTDQAVPESVATDSSASSREGIGILLNGVSAKLLAFVSLFCIRDVLRSVGE